MIKYKLTDLVDEATLQNIQENFSQVTGMACLIINPDGKPATEKHCFSEFCEDYIRKSETGKTRCELCGKKAILESLRTRKAALYFCHSRLVEFAAPIVVEGELMGGIVGGQARIANPESQTMIKSAEQLGINPKIYIEKFSQITFHTKDEIKKSSKYLERLAKIISQIAFCNLKRIEQILSSEKAARSQTLFVTDMAFKMKHSMDQWMTELKSLLNLESSRPVRRDLQKILSEGKETDSIITDFVDYIKMTEGATNLSETIYSLRQFLPQTFELLQKEIVDKDISISFEIDGSVPPVLYGDYGRIAQIVMRLVRGGISRMNVGYIKIKAACKDESYAKMLEIDVSDSSKAFSEQEISNIRSYFETGISALIEKSLTKGLGYPMIAMLLKQLSGSIEIQNRQPERTVFAFKIPQLAIDKNGKRA